MRGEHATCIDPNLRNLCLRNLCLLSRTSLPGCSLVAGVFEWPWDKYTGRDSEDHAVTLIGWGIEPLKNGTRLPYWTVSWDCAGERHAMLRCTVVCCAVLCWPYGAVLVMPCSFHSAPLSCAGCASLVLAFLVCLIRTTCLPHLTLVGLCRSRTRGQSTGTHRPALLNCSCCFSTPCITHNFLRCDGPFYFTCFELTR